MKVLIIEDDKGLQSTIKAFLEQERFIVEVASTVDEGVEKVSLYSYDCILLDIMLPDGNGMEVLDALKKEGKQEYVIIISAKDSVEDKVSGLELGADDYLAKPFHLLELHARIKNVLRRKSGQTDNSIRIGNVTLYPDTFTVKIGEQTVELKRKEYDILHYFLTRPHRVIDKSMLAEAVWGDNIDQADSFDFIYAQIKNLRKRMKEAEATIEIKAVYGFGYKLIEK